jgi:sulfite oxidase
MNTRRSFLKKSFLGSQALVWGVPVVYGSVVPEKYPFVGKWLADPEMLPGKNAGLKVLGERPWNIETPPHLLDDKVTPADKMFVRNNGLMPDTIDVANWSLTINGESAKTTKSYSIAELKSKFKTYTYQLTIECGGNGRAEFNPPAKGNQWEVGAVSCAKWTGVRLKDILMDVGIKDDAVYIGYYGKDVHLSKDPEKVVISRGVPIAKALEDETLVAWAMNGEDIPLANGHPLRLVVGGWPGSTSGKWLSTISVRNVVHDGEKMGGDSYRVPCEAVAPGEVVPDENMCIIEGMPVKSVITYPKTGAMIKAGQTLPVRGHAWVGDRSVKEVLVSADFGATWQKAELEGPANRLAWQHFSAKLKLPATGYHEIWAKATDSDGKSQPMVVPGWNPKGYLNNACHRIAVKVR